MSQEKSYEKKSISLAENEGKFGVIPLEFRKIMPKAMETPVDAVRKMMHNFSLCLLLLKHEVL